MNPNEAKELTAINFIAAPSYPTTHRIYTHAKTHRRGKIHRLQFALFPLFFQQIKLNSLLQNISPVAGVMRSMFR